MLLCPQCGRQYRRRDFDRDESYFECDTCSTELLDDGRTDEDTVFATQSAANSLESAKFNYNVLGLTPEAAEHVLRTPADIARTYGPAIILHRWFARVIDHLVLILTAVLIGSILGLIVGDNGFVVAGVLLLIGWFAYFAGLDGTVGYTLGKRLCGLRVVDEDGRVPGFEKGMIRTLTCLIEMNPVLFGALPAVILVLVSNTRQRLGDSLAKTYVLKAEDIHLIA